MRNKKSARNFFISIIPYLIIISIFEFLAAYLGGSNFNQIQTADFSQQTFLIITFFGMLGSLFAVWLLRKFLDKKNFSGIGFTTVNIAKDILLGVLFGLCIMLAGFYILKMTGQISAETIPFNTNEFLLTAGVFVFVTIGEEAYFRGYALGNLMETYGKYTALIISALFFAIVHSLNPDFSIWSFIGIFIAGIFLGISYLYTKSLWFPIGLHFGWNFFQSLMGFNVSGMDTYSLYKLTYDKETLWNGGRFGFESSLLGFILQLAAIYAVYHIFSNRKSSHHNNL